MKFVFLVALSLLGSTYSQQAGTNTEEYHPPLRIQVCDETGCTSEDTSVVIDADVRPLYSVEDGETICFSNGEFDPDLCPDGETCAQNCALDGLSQEDYLNLHGVSADGDALRLNYLTDTAYGTTIGSRVYVSAPDDSYYRLFKLKNREIAVDVDMTTLPCGMNGAFYFIEMEEDGGSTTYPTNQAGAKYGVGYCDAQCFHYYRYSNGQVNIESQSEYGVCCNEMDIWEANAWAQTYTTHSCTVDGYYICEPGLECGDDSYHYDGVCDKDGCDFGSYRLNQHDYYGANNSYQVDASQVFTLVTQFITEDGTDDTDLVEIRRVYVQNGNIIENAPANWEEIDSYDSLTNDYCVDVKELYDNYDDFTPKGSLKTMGDSFDRGMVLSMSIWEDASSHMLWLDSISPPDADPSVPGISRGPCSIYSGRPKYMHTAYPDSYVTFSNIKIGTINSTFP